MKFAVMKQGHFYSEEDQYSFAKPVGYIDIDGDRASFETIDEAVNKRLKRCFKNGTELVMKDIEEVEHHRYVCVERKVKPGDSLYEWALSQNLPNPYPTYNM